MRRRIAFIAQGLELDVQESDGQTAWAVYDADTNEQLINGSEADFDAAVDAAVTEVNQRLAVTNAD